jgi:hypothetical protein
MSKGSLLNSGKLIWVSSALELRALELLLGGV